MSTPTTEIIKALEEAVACIQEAADQRADLAIPELNDTNDGKYLNEWEKVSSNFLSGARYSIDQELKKMKALAYDEAVEAARSERLKWQRLAKEEADGTLDVEAEIKRIYVENGMYVEGKWT